jgi:membrane-associated protein
MTDVALSLLDGIAALPLWALAIVVALAVTAESSLFVGLVVPGDIIVLLAASGGASPQRIVLLILAVAAGSVAGETIGYGIGRRWGGRVRTSRLGRALGDARWDKAADVLGRHGARAVFGARYVAALHAVLPVLAGTLEMPRRRFLSWSAAGALSWATIYVGAGAAAGASFRQAAEHLTTVTLAVVGLAAVIATVVHLRSKRQAAALDATPTAVAAPAETALAAAVEPAAVTAPPAGRLADRADAATRISAAGRIADASHPDAHTSATGRSFAAVGEAAGATTADQLTGARRDATADQVARTRRGAAVDGLRGRAADGRHQNVRWASAPAGMSGGNGGQGVPGRNRDDNGGGSEVRAAAAPPPTFVACCGCGCDDLRATDATAA